MTPEQRWILDVVDVLALRLECTKCGIAVVIKPADWRDAPLQQCPGCRGFWGLPADKGLGFTPLQHLGIGLRLLLGQASEMAKHGDEMPYRVKFEIHDPTLAKYAT